MTVYLQEGDAEPFASGFVPPETLKAIFEDPVAKPKPFDLVLMEGDKSVGTLKIAIKPVGLVQVQEAQQVAEIADHLKQATKTEEQ